MKYIEKASMEEVVLFQLFFTFFVAASFFIKSANLGFSSLLGGLSYSIPSLFFMLHCNITNSFFNIYSDYLFLLGLFVKMFFSVFLVCMFSYLFCDCLVWYAYIFSLGCVSKSFLVQMLCKYLYSY
ncbi:hypothetical protein [Candidatus Kinetoplastidibacterium crithidiae]|uniref:ATP synthase I-like protein n=1 Tax=Candidatus Kinetoplastidibacterium crithidiae TCC036E TaxID=1208918 RepID=M1LTC6_9PROT|nr:hypothetical protein [Candidatus Kinetoplastibacterium crithidii]AFZ83073.1 hypothetical protein CKCE_0656 [Candidatus Kinetoplastibacterium crithidii (ex Angomonas deanei ATCC 30255)]AGF47351.1 ATP synthase I-like protein [Candidatus Kinetoplastibacterium crithidii TCC036E]